MPEETNAASPEAQPPDDFNDYVAYRQALAEGKPIPEPQNPPAPAEKTEAKTTATDSGTGRPQEQEEEEEEEDEEEGAAADTKETKEPPKRKGGFQRRIDQLTKEKRALEARVAALEPPPAHDAGRGSAKPDAAQANVAEKPKREDFSTDEEFLDARIEWKQTQREQQQAAKQAELEAAKAQHAIHTAWTERESEAKRTVSDYDETLASADDLKFHEVVGAALVRHPDGPRLAYELARDRKTAEKLAAIKDPLEAAIVFGAFAARFANSDQSDSVPKPKAPAVTGAPNPVTPLRNGRGRGSTQDIYDPQLADDYNAWERARRAQKERS